MPIVVNKIKNPDFSRGKRSPQAWQWSSTSPQAQLIREPQSDGDGGPLAKLQVENASASAFVTQRVICKPEEYYRVEVTASCDLKCDDELSGLTIYVASIQDDKIVGEPRFTPPIRRCSQAKDICAIFHAPEGVRRVDVSVGIQNATGSATLHEVRFIRVLESDEVSHPLAIPAPRHTLTPPRLVKQVAVCSASAEDRPLTGLLELQFGKKKVSAIKPKDFLPSKFTEDAIFLPDALPPASLRTLRSLKQLAHGRIVVISLPAFTSIAGKDLSMRRIEQDDDPIHALVAYANFATHGFALQDAFSYAWPGKLSGSYVQNQFRRTPSFKAFCTKHGFDTLLESMCDKDSTTNQPICLFHETDGGALFVLDIDPVEAKATSLGAPSLAAHLIMAILGEPQTGLGQYCVPEETETDFRGMLRDMPPRFEEFVVHDEDIPIEEVTHQMVTVGREDASFGLPLQPKPVIIIRSGLQTGNFECAYSAFNWFKQLVRMPPHFCPYGTSLATKFRIAWLPLLSDWDTANGWQRPGTSPDTPIDIEFEDSTIAALIDIVPAPINQAGIVLQQGSAAFSKYAHWIPRLFETFGQYSRPAWTVPEGASFTDMDAYNWRHVSYKPTVTTEQASLSEPIQQSALANNGEIIRIEIPSSDMDFRANSIVRTDVATTLLEHVIGLQYGLIAVNRGTKPIALDAWPRVSPGEALIVEPDDPTLTRSLSRAG